ncbi:hypothetical protein WG68_14325 [Arsukibacterium ikkense]|uniref:RNA polymerase sigma 70 n=1 Tax=Arsukibacterium ikkense TaxID=336831 RepID=A0A0M2V1J7_9GAMM|nr:RNA polymerase sigma factor [Arsukibacterium ikkense]KKO44717.1 hypothetical protein WG68_14325 [Arsukibacterium ikkense]
MNRKVLGEILPDLRRYCYSLTGSIADADDLVQSVLEKILRKPVPAEVPVLKWAFRVCSNMWIDEYRARQVRNNAVDNELHQATAAIDSEATMQLDETLKQVQLALAELEPEQRQILALIAVRGMSYQEVADILQIPTGTVMSRLGRARVQLTKQMLLLEQKGRLA